MKKVISLALVLVMLTAMAIPAFAKVIEDPEKTGGTTISVTIQPEWTVTIPETAVLDTPFEVKAENVNVANTLTVAITKWTNDSTDANTFVLANGTKYIPCTVKTSDTEAGEATVYTLGGDILSITDDQEKDYVAKTAVSKWLTVTRANPDTVYTPGEYKGTMNFSIEG